MVDFDSTFSGFFKGEVGFEDLQSAIKKEVLSHPESKEKIKTELDNRYRDGQLPVQLYQMFCSALQEATEQTDIPPSTESDTPIPENPLQTASSENISSTHTTKNNYDDDRTRIAPSVQEIIDNKDDDRTQIQPSLQSYKNTEYTDSGIQIGSDNKEASISPERMSAIDHATQTDSDTSKGSISAISQSNSSKWNHPTDEQNTAVESLDVGSVIRDRYKLIEKAGEGGMGVVFKAMDLLNVEAGDRNPYVAVKILNESFSQHRDSLKALHREASKAQKLAHPNIINVYNFDKDAGHVFMTMEFLSGIPLDEYIAAHPNGQPFDKVKPLIKGMAEGLAYAHSKKIIHSDFKPGNIFVEKGMHAKIIDFGIARAAKSTAFEQETDDDGDKTNFDAGSLGALTPAYASSEMLQGGVDPGPEDDIYALACITYELLAGHHPFLRNNKRRKKMRADEAQKNSLKPPRIKNLNRKEWNTLREGLYFSREKRCSSANTFAENLCGEQQIGSRKLYIISGVTILIIGAAAAYIPVQNYLNEQEIDGIVKEIKTGDKETIERILLRMKSEGEELQKRITTRAGVSKSLADYYIKQANMEIDVTKGKYAYPKANKILNEALTYYPDSFVLNDYKRILSERKDKLLNELTKNYNYFLSKEILLPEDAEENINTILSKLSKVDPEHALHKDIRLETAYISSTRKSLKELNYKRANALVLAGSTAFPESSSLIDLADNIAAILQNKKNKEQIKTLEETIIQHQGTLNALVDFKDIGSTILDLREVSPENIILKELDKQLEKFLGSAIHDAVTQKEFTNAFDLLSEYGGLTTQTYFDTEENNVETMLQKHEKSIDIIFSELMKAAAENNLSKTSETSALVLLQRFKALSPEDTRIQQAQNSIAQAYINKSRQYRNEESWENSRIQIDLALALDISSDLFDSLNLEIEKIKEAKIDSKKSIAQAEYERIEHEKSVTIKKIKSDFTALIEKYSPGKSDSKPLLTLLDDLATVSPTDSMLKQGRSDISAKYLKRMRSIEKDGRYQDAIILGRTGLKVIPESIDILDELLKLERQDNAAVTAQKENSINIAKQDLEELITESKINRQWENKIRQRIDGIEKLIGKDTQWLFEQKEKVAKIFLRESKSRKNENRFSEAKRFLDKAASYALTNTLINNEIDNLEQARLKFETQTKKKALVAQINGYKQTLITQAKANDIKAAKTTWYKLEKLLPDEDDFRARIGPNAIAEAHLRLAQKLAKRKEFSVAIKLANDGLKIASEHTALTQAIENYQSEIALNKFLKEVLRSTPNKVKTILYNLSSKISPTRYKTLIGQIDNIYSDYILKSSSTDFKNAKELLSETRKTFPEFQKLQSVKLTTPPSPLVKETQNAIDSKHLSLAKNTIIKIPKSGANNKSITRLKKLLSEKTTAAEGVLETYKTFRDKKQWDQAITQLEKAQDMWKDNISYKTENSHLKTLIAQSTAIKEATPVPKTIATKQIPTKGRPCISKYAGHGKRPRAVCYDFIAPGEKGPLMVVVKSGEGFDKPYAIGRSEVTIKNYNAYCRLSSQCKELTGDVNIPVTGLNYEAIISYTKWLNQSTGYEYRLPQVSEWEYAASANGKWSKTGINCRIVQGSKLVKGRSLVDSRSGSSNGWGVKHAVGNAQELVLSDNKLIARGGSYMDGYANCDLSTEHAVKGEPDNTMGFRLVRLID